MTWNLINKYYFETKFGANDAVRFIQKKGNDATIEVTDLIYIVNEWVIK